MVTANYCIAVCYVSSASATDRYEPTWESLDQKRIRKWFADAKFGIFIWGLDSVPAYARGTYAGGIGMQKMEIIKTSSSW